MSWHRVRTVSFVLAVAALAGASALAASPGAAGSSARQPGPWCGGPAWKLATLNDADRRKVALAARETSIPRIAALKAPAKIGSRRATGFQRRAWHLNVVVQDYRVGTDGEIALVLYDIPSATYMNAYLANPKCLSSGTPMRKAMIAARAELIGRCGRVTPAWQALGASASITGVGYWNPLKVTKGALRNGAELRPITGFTITSGCGVG